MEELLLLKIIKVTLVLKKGEIEISKQYIQPLS